MTSETSALKEPIEAVKKIKGIPENLLYLVKKNPIFDDIKNTNIDDLDITLNVNVYNDLKTVGIKTIGELIMYSIKELGYMGLRTKSLIKLKEMADKYGFNFKADEMGSRTKNLSELEEMIGKTANKYGFVFKKNDLGYILNKKESLE